MLRSRIRSLHEARDSFVVQTWSPLVIFEITSRWIRASEGDWLERVCLRRAVTESDVRLVDVREPTWLAHFALEDLYMRREFDDFLGLIDDEL